MWVAAELTCQQTSGGGGRHRTDRQQLSEVCCVFQLCLRIVAPHALHHGRQVLQLQNQSMIGIECHVAIHSQISCRACTFCAAAPPPPRVESSIAALSWPVANIIRFFCRFSSRFVFLSSTMLSSLLRRASSASMPFLKPFFRASARLVGRSMFEWAALGLPTLALCDATLAMLQPTLDLLATVPEAILP